MLHELRLRLAPAWQRQAVPRLRQAVQQRHTTTTAATTATTAETTETTPLPPQHMVSRLPNGVRVATESVPFPFAALGVYVDAGSRYEPARLRGATHMIDRMAFKSTARMSSIEVLEAFERLGANHVCASSRENIMYQAAVLNHQVDDMLGLLADTVLRPVLADDELAMQARATEYELREIWGKPEAILPEIINSAAFRDNTLGKPLLCPLDRLFAITRADLVEYRQMFFRPERLVVALVGVDHDTALRLTETHFGGMRPLPAQSQPDNSASRYTGGTIHLPPPPPPAKPLEFTHIHVAFEGLPISHPDIYALATLQMLLGGGGSFSAGGPGKGMYSRLYTNVLNQHGWVDSCVAFNNSYIDSGLFGISASVMHQAADEIINVICREFLLLFTQGPRGLDETEVNRAKKQIQSAILMNVESRMIELEDMGRQIQTLGKRDSVQHMCGQVEKLTVKDLQRVAETVLTGQIKNPGSGSGRPAVVTMGREDACGDVLGSIKKWGLGRT